MHGYPLEYSEDEKSTDFFTANQGGFFFASLKGDAKRIVGIGG
jgi:hypothetical protein